MSSIKLGEKVRSKVTGKVYVVATFSDRYRNIDRGYVRDNVKNFVEVVD